MEMIEVQSSNVAAIGYDPDVLVLAVRYRDGHLYVRPNVSPGTWAALLAAPSKGKFVAGLNGLAIQVSTERRNADQPIEITPEQRAVSHAADGPLNVIDEDADKCCDATLRAFGGDRLAPWECPKCGLRFEAQMIGPVRRWRIVPTTAIVRRRG
jgi:hypothetical protein